MKPISRARLLPRILGALVVIAVVAALARPDSPREAPAPAPEAEDTNDIIQLKPLPPIPRVHAGALRAVLAAPPVLEAPEILDGPLVLLPPDTVALLAVPSWSAFADRVGLGDLLMEHQWRLAKLDDALGEAGLSIHDLVDPSGIGVDPSGSMFIATLDVRAPVVVVGARLLDAGAFERALGFVMSAAAEHGGHGFRTEEMGEAIVTIEGGERPQVAFIRRGGMVYLLGCESWSGDLEMAVAQIAWQDPEQGLLTTDAWLKTMGQVRGRDGFAFVNFPAINVQTRMAMQRSMAETETMWEGQEHTEWADEMVARQQASGTLAEASLGSFGGFGAGIELASGRLEVDARLDMGPGTLFAGMLRNRTSHSTLQRALSEQPAFLMDGALNPAALRQLMALFFAVGGQDFEQAMTIAGPSMGLEGDPFDQLSGELGIAMTAPRDGEPLWGATVVLGIVDAEAADEALSRLTTLGEMTGLIKRDPDVDAMVFEVPAWRTLYVARAGQAIVATSDVAVLDRLRGGYSTSPASWKARPEVSALAGSIGDAGALLWDFSALDDSIRDMGYYEEPPVPEGASADDRALADIQRRMTDARRDTDAAVATHGQELLRLLGTIVGTARVEGSSLSMRGAWVYEASSTRELLARIAEHATAIDDAEDTRNAVLDPLYEEQRAILSRIGPE